MTTLEKHADANVDKAADFERQLFAAVLRSRTGALTGLSRLLRFQTGTKGFEREYNRQLPLIGGLRTAYWEQVKECLPKNGLRLGIIDDSSVKKAGKKFPKQQIHHEHSDNTFYSGMKVLTSLVYQNGKAAAVSSRLVGKEDNKLEIATQDIDALIGGFSVGIFLFDAWYCKNPVLGHIAAQGKKFVSRIRKDSKVIVEGMEMQLAAYAGRLSHSDFRHVRIHGTSYWLYDAALEFAAYGKLRVIISKMGVHGKLFFIVTNALNFTDKFVISLYLTRFAIEVFFKDAKQFLNFETFQCRAPEKWELHLLLVNVLHWAIQKRNSISRTVRAIRESLEACQSYINRNLLLNAFFGSLRAHRGELAENV